jgi:hypothetical protein
MKQCKMVSFLAAMLLPATALYAGVHHATEVHITLDTQGNAIGASGGLAAAHNSADANQSINCVARLTGGFCFAHDATADTAGAVNSALCFTQDATFLARIGTIDSDAFVAFGLDPTTGQCTTIEVRHNSAYGPKVP